MTTGSDDNSQRGLAWFFCDGRDCGSSSRTGQAYATVMEMMSCCGHGNLVGGQAPQDAGHVAVSTHTINACTACNVLYALRALAPRLSTAFPCRRR